MRIPNLITVTQNSYVLKYCTASYIITAKVFLSCTYPHLFSTSTLASKTVCAYK